MQASAPELRVRQQNSAEQALITNGRTTRVRVWLQADIWHTLLVRLSIEEIIEEVRDWPEDVVADLVDRIMRAKYGEAEPAEDGAWREEIRRRLDDLESGRVQGVPSEETLTKARKIAGL